MDVKIYDSSDEIVQNALNHHMTTLLNKPTDVELEITVEMLVYSIPKISNLETTVLKGKIVEADVVEKFLSINPSHKNVRVHTEITGSLKKNSLLFGIQFLHLSDETLPVNIILPYFTGEHLTIATPKCDNSAIIEFLNSWISCKKYQNIRTVIILSTNGSPMNPTEILGNFRTSRGPSRRPYEYMYPVK
ncbi:hypothetical protein GCK72_013966 [Caenorhabditis remanei]|uniref:F-box associated domain-containing protein n=1 Tax=Caenorhabditis remanei TaxID=31234 RepID=A0A6A5GQ38_CAERE|nr:hypothetical protein GCK72_013966 [Caenorhabditis remanei]KAF1757510.1 hypothetical protein GCK72_013966 [Caenorhabditis remanei]